MKATLEITVNFESWFDDDREPKTKEEWAEFFSQYFITENGVIGLDGEYQDLVLLEGFSVECLDIENV